MQVSVYLNIFMLDLNLVHRMLTPMFILGLSLIRISYYSLVHLHVRIMFKIYIFYWMQLAYLHDQKELLEHLEEGNVSVGMGGVLNYDHRNWVYSRIVSYPVLVLAGGDTLTV